MRLLDGGRDRLFELDALRGIAATTVLVAHYSHYASSRYHTGGLPFHLEGHWAVLLFFVISGFVIAMSLERSRTPRDFALSRVSRIYPAYWFSVIVTFLVVLTFGLPGRQVSWGAMVVNLTMLHSWFNVPAVDSIYWTLCAELSFYFWISIVHFSALRARALSLSAVWLLGTAAYQFAERRGILVLPEIWRLTFLTQFAPFFVAGMMFFRIWRGVSGWREHGVIALAYAVFLCQRNGGTVAVVALGIFGLFYLVVGDRMKWLGRGPLIWLGGISYSLYLLHENIGYVVISQLNSRGVPVVAGELMAAAVAVGLATTSAVMIERPVMAWMRRYRARGSDDQVGTGESQYMGTVAGIPRAVAGGSNI